MMRILLAIILFISFPISAFPEVVRSMSDYPFESTGVHTGTCVDRPYRFIVDNTDAAFTTNQGDASPDWQTGTAVPTGTGYSGFYGANFSYVKAPATNPENTWAKWDLSGIDHPGLYQVMFMTSDWSTNENAYYTVVSDDGQSSQIKVQTASLTGGRWRYLGVYNFDGTNDYIKVDASETTATYYIIADSVMLVELGAGSLKFQASEFTDSLYWSEDCFLCEKPPGWTYRTTDRSTYYPSNRMWEYYSDAVTMRLYKYFDGNAVDGITIDDEDDETSSTGTWAEGSPGASYAYNGDLYYKACQTDDGSGNVYEFTPTITSPGLYNVYIRWYATANRGEDVEVTVYYDQNQTDVHVIDMRSAPTADKTISSLGFELLGQYQFDGAGTEKISINNECAAVGSDYAIADAVHFEFDPDNYKIFDQDDNFGFDYILHIPAERYFTGYVGLFYSETDNDYNFVGLKVMEDPAYVYDVYAAIIETDGTEHLSSVGNQMLTYGKEYNVSCQYVTATGTLTVTITDVSDSAVWSDSVTITPASESFVTNVIGIGGTGDTGGRIMFGDEVSVWEGTSKAYKSSGSWISTQIISDLYPITATGTSQWINDWGIGASPIRSTINGTLYYDNKTYISYCKELGNETTYVGVAIYDHISKEWSDKIIGIGADDHGSYAIMLDDQENLHLFGGAHGTTLDYRYTTTPKDLTTLTEGTDPVTEATYPNAYLVATNKCLLIYAGPWENSDTYRPMHYKIGQRTGGDDYDSWSAESILARWDEDTSHRIYFATRQAENGDVYISAYKTDWDNANATNCYCWKYDSSAEAFTNLYEESLTLPLCLSFPADTIASTTSSSITLTTNAEADDYWNGKWVQDDTTGNYYKITDWTQSTKTAAVTGDPYTETGACHIVEKYIRIYNGSGSTSHPTPYGNGDTPDVFVGYHDSSNDSIVARCNYSTHAWDSTTIDSVYSGAVGPIFADSGSGASIVLRLLRVQDESTKTTITQWNSTDSGVTWSEGSELYTFPQNLGLTDTNPVAIMPIYSTQSELNFLFATQPWPGGFTTGGSCQVLAFGTTYPDYISTHQMKEVNYTVSGGTPTIKLRCSTNAQDVQSAAQCTLSGNPVTDFSGCDGESNAQSIEIEIVPPADGEALTWWEVTLGATPYSSAMYHYKNQQ